MRSESVWAVLLIAALAAVLPPAGPAAPHPDVGGEQAGLEKILKGCALYSERLRQIALYFVCRERIEDESYVFRGGNPYKANVIDRRDVRVYDYQFIRRGGEIEETRTLIEENGKKRDEKNAKPKAVSFYSERSFFGPIGLLDEKYQPLFRYELIGEDEVFGRRAFVLKAVPKRIPSEIPNYGQVWIDRERFAVLRIDIDQESLVGFEALKADAKRRGLSPDFRVVHEYEFEKNGIRFPSRTLFLENYSGPMVIRAAKSRVTIRYSDYRFFVVETEIKTK